MKRYLSLLVASTFLVGCSAEEPPAPEPTPVALETTTSATPTSTMFPVAGAGFSDVEKLAADIQPLLPEGGRVATDPKGKNNTLSVSLPEGLADADVDLALEKMEPLVIAAWQAHGVETTFGRRYADDFVMLVEPYDERSVGDLRKLWSIGMATAPAMQGHTKLGKVTPSAVFLLDNKEFTREECSAFLTGLKDNFDNDALADSHDFVIKVRHCGPNSINLVGKKHEMGAKLEAGAAIMGQPELLPDDTHLAALMDGDLDLDTATPASPELIAAVQQQWPLGEVIPVKRNT